MAEHVGRAECEQQQRGVLEPQRHFVNSLVAVGQQSEPVGVGERAVVKPRVPKAVMKDDVVRGQWCRRAAAFQAFGNREWVVESAERVGKHVETALGETLAHGIAEATSHQQQAALVGDSRFGGWQRDGGQKCDGLCDGLSGLLETAWN